MVRLRGVSAKSEVGQRGLLGIKMVGGGEWIGEHEAQQTFTACKKAKGVKLV